MSQTAVASQSAGLPTFPAFKPGTSVKATVGAASVQSSAFGAATTLVRVHVTEDTHLAFGADPTVVADGTGLFMPAGTIEYFGVTPGQKLAHIRNSASGSIYLTEGA